MKFKLKKKEKNYAQVHVNMLRDKDLSLKAKGLGAVLESYSNDFNVSLKSIELGSTDKETSIKTAIKELEQGYYLFRFQTHDEDGRFETYWAFDSEKLNVEYLKNIIVELEKVELVTINDFLVTAPRFSGGGKSGTYKNIEDENKRDNKKEKLLKEKNQKEQSGSGSKIIKTTETKIWVEEAGKIRIRPRYTTHKGGIN